jgi:hypothetical protein
MNAFDALWMETKEKAKREKKTTIDIYDNRPGIGPFVFGS